MKHAFFSLRPGLIGSTAIVGAVAAFLSFGATRGDAVLTFVEAGDDPAHCDTLSVPSEVHEIGWGAATPLGPFPPNEELTSRNLPLTVGPPCPVHDNPQILDAVVQITNLTGIDWTEVWYVADHDTTITNWDGFVVSPATGANPGFPLLAFKIDAVGANQPLLTESIVADGIWQAGESWDFVIQDWSNATFAASDFGSIGLDSLPPGFGLPGSSASIIAIPEPGAAALLLLSGLGLFMRRRR